MKIRGTCGRVHLRFRWLGIRCSHLECNGYESEVTCRTPCFTSQHPNELSLFQIGSNSGQACLRIVGSWGASYPMRLEEKNGKKWKIARASFTAQPMEAGVVDLKQFSLFLLCRVLGYCQQAALPPSHRQEKEKERKGKTLLDAALLPLTSFPPRTIIFWKRS